MAHNLINRPCFHAPDVVQERRFFPMGYHTPNLAEQQIPLPVQPLFGCSTQWPILIIIVNSFSSYTDLKEGAKSVCVVNHISDSTLFVTCLQHSISFYAVFEHIWEMIDPYPINAVRAALRVRQATAIRNARDNEIQRRLTPAVRVARRSTEVRLYRYES
jgi:hypothetical protein